MSVNNTGSILLRRGPTTDRILFCPLDGEIIYDSTLKKVYVGDGQTYGGIQVGGSNILYIDQLLDVNTSSSPPINGQALIWDSSSSAWIPQSLSGAGVYVLPTASTSILGGVKVDGTTITISNGVISSSGGGSSYTLPTASTSILGGVKVDGTTITINGSGVISSTGGGGGISGITVKSSNVTQGTAGGITTLNFSGSGVSTSASGNTATMIINTGSYTLPTASTSILGGVKVDGTSIIINGSGVISATGGGGGGSYTLPTASTSILGGVKVDGTTITINGSGVISASLSLFTGKLQSYSETVVSAIVSSATFNIDLSTANIFDITLSNNVTFTFTNPPTSGSLFSATVILRQDSVGNRLATFTNAKYSDGILPVLSTGVNQIDVMSFFTVNGGSMWFGTFAMANVS